MTIDNTLIDESETLLDGLATKPNVKRLAPRSALKVSKEGYLVRNGLLVKPIFETLRHCRFQYVAHIRLDGTRLANPSSHYDGERGQLLVSALNYIRKAFGLSFRTLNFAASVEYGIAEKVHLHVLFSFHPYDPDELLGRLFECVLEGYLMLHGISDVVIERVRDQEKAVAYCFKKENTAHDTGAFILSPRFADILATIKAKAAKGIDTASPTRKKLTFDPYGHLRAQSAKSMMVPPRPKRHKRRLRLNAV